MITIALSRGRIYDQTAPLLKSAGIVARDDPERSRKLIEVTSNDRRAQAHAFYRHMGYERTSIRFFKKL